jgi:opacity protein-like surface antigen
MAKVRNAAFAFIGAAALSVPSISMAQSTMSTMTQMGPEAGWYVGGSVGQSKIDCSTGGVAGVSCDDSDTAFRVLGGYQFNKYLGAELGYADLGKATLSAAGLSASVEAKAWDLVAVGRVPVADRFSLFGKLGMYRADSDLSSNTALIPASSDDNTDVTYGLGAQYDFNKNLGVRAEWQQYKKVGSDSTGGEGDVDVMSVGVVYRFK